VPPLAVIGNLARDRIDGGVRAGGGPYHAARGLRRLATAQATIVTKAADRSLLPALVALGLPVRFHEATATSTFAIADHGDAREMQVEELGEPWTPEEARGWVADAVGKAQWLHVAPLLRSDFPAETLAELARGRRILLDGQGLVRVARVGPLAEDDAYDRDVLRHVTVLKLAEEEARIVLPDLSTDSLARLGVPEVLVTFGSRGSLVYANGTSERVAARPVHTEATGAGDAFSATYLASRAAGYAPVAAAERAARLVESLLANPR
jgi:sugar/nucleoside kinase (ribokinase family)